MIVHYTSGQRRALNQVWNGAEIYGFEPLFLSMNTDGTPNLYLNTIVGCVRKWYGEEGPSRLFEAWAEDRRQALLDDLAWLALESAAFQRELPHRPILAGLRRDYATEFFDREYSLSRQEWMSKNQLSYTMQSARWKAVLGMRPPVMTPYEKRLSAALELGPLEEGELFPAILELFARFHLFDGRSRPPPILRFHLTGKWAGMMTRLMPTEIVHTDVASVGRGAGADEGSGPRLDTCQAKIRLKEDASSDRKYIASCFGPSLLSERELAAAEQELCTGIHLGCHLWYTAGVPTPEQAPNEEARRLAQQAQLQQERNRAAFGADSALYHSAIRSLTEQIRNCLQVHSQAEEENARCGRLNSRRIWRAAHLAGGGAIRSAGFYPEDRFLPSRLYGRPAAGRLILPDALPGGHRRPGVHPLRKLGLVRRSRAGVWILQPAGLYHPPGTERLWGEQPECFPLLRHWLEPGRPGSPGGGGTAG